MWYDPVVVSNDDSNIKPTHLMQLNLYTNNAYDTVALVKDGKIISRWEATAPGSDGHKTAFEEALHTNNPDDWDGQGEDIATDDFEVGNDLYLSIHDNGEWEVNDRDLTAARLGFLLGADHPITKAFSA